MDQKEKQELQKMTLKHNIRTLRFLSEHHDNCTECKRAFIRGERTHLGYKPKRKLIYVGNCCSHLLIETIVRHSYEQRDYSIPDDNTVLWRFMDFTKFVSLLQTKSLFFSRADMFDDVFEGARGLLKNKPIWDKYYLNYFIHAIKTAPGEEERNRSEEDILKDAKRLLIQFNSKDKTSSNTFISCWHENKYESEAMWKLYTSSLEQGIAIRTTYKRLYHSLGRNPYISIGRVNYIDYSQQFARHSSTYWFKRKSFEHEKEVRAITYDRNLKEETGKMIPVDLSSLIDKVYLSPTSQKWFYDLLKDVMDKYNLKKKIIFSDLKETPFF